MKFALLGEHPDARCVRLAIARHPEHAVSVVVAEMQAAEVLAIAPGVRLVESWEDLLATDSCDAVLIAGSDESAIAGAKQLAADGRPLFLVPQAAQGSAFIYELTLIHDDNRVPLVPVVLWRSHPLVEQLQAALLNGELGRVVLLRIERGLSARSLTTSSTTTLSREAINAALLDDVLLLRTLAGSFSRITAVYSGAGAGAGTDGVSMATVTLGGEGLPEATWIARVAAPAWSLSVSGTDGEAVLQLNRETLSGQLEIRPSNAPHRKTDDDGATVGARALDAMLACGDRAPALWTDLTRAFETVEATAASLRRRRTIDMHFEATSERAIFKSHMAASGCGLLLLTLFSLIAFLLLGAFLDSISRTQRIAIADGRIIQTTEFAGESADLNDSGLAHIAELTRQMARAPGPIFVMPAESASSELNTERVRAVVTVFAQHGHPEAASLVDVAESQNPFAQLLLQVLRILWIAPLAIFLVMQLLLFISRPSSQEQSDEEESPTN